MARIEDDHQVELPSHQSSHGFDDKNYWTEAEKTYFLFAIFVFDKDFIWVRRFIETKDMGEILCYYYGKFRLLSEYNRLKTCRKMNSQKGSFGWRIFSGCRQKLLLSRILPRLTGENSKQLLKVIKVLGDNKNASLTDYVFSLKAIVGKDILVEAVGLGNENEDLARMALEPWRWTEVTGEALSSLSPTKIIETINARLTKRRACELLWEAVWPRLVARGWHSGYLRKKNDSMHLVFLRPGISFNKGTKLKRGKQYFDCVISLLEKVAKEPHLIEVNGAIENTTLEITPPLAQTYFHGDESHENLELQENTGSTQQLEPTTAIELDVVLVVDSSPQRCASFDLNVPYLEEEEDEQPESSNNSSKLNNSERRHSTRSRPPTSRLRDNAAYGYEKAKKKIKDEIRES